MFIVKRTKIKIVIILQKRLRHYLNWVRSQYFHWKMSHNTFENAEVFFRACRPYLCDGNGDRLRKRTLNVIESSVFRCPHVNTKTAFLKTFYHGERFWEVVFAMTVFTDRIRLPSWPMRKEKRFQTKWDTHCITLFHNVKLLFIGTCACNFLQFSILPDEGWWWTAELLYQT